MRRKREGKKEIGREKEREVGEKRKREVKTISTGTGSI